jgi:DNA-binding MarR family transcriptional regulator
VAATLVTPTRTVPPVCSTDNLAAVSTEPEPRAEWLAVASDQWVGRGWGDPKLMSAVSSVVRVERLLTAMVDAALRPLDLTFARYEALAALYFSPDGGMPLGKMSELLQVHPATITSIVDRLEQQQLVRRTRPDGDRRVVLAEILPDGRTLVEQATDVVVTDVFPKLPWTEDEVSSLAESLHKVRQTFGKVD